MLWKMGKRAMCGLVCVGAGLMVADGAAAASKQIRIKSPELKKADSLVTTSRGSGAAMVEWSYYLYSESVDPNGNKIVDEKKKKNGTGFKPRITVSETKVDPIPGGAGAFDQRFKGKNSFTGVSDTAKTPYAEVSVNGGGNSSIVSKVVQLPPPNAPQTVYGIQTSSFIELNGKLTLPNTPPKMVSGEYDGVARVKDPIPINREELVDFGFDPQNFDVLLTFGIESYSKSSDIVESDIDVFFETVDGEMELFSLFSTPLAATSVFFSPDASFFELSDFDATPDFMSPIDPSQFGAALAQDIDADGMLDAPLYLSALLTGVSLPAADLAPDAAAAFGFESNDGVLSADVGEVPAPPAVVLIASALAALCGVGARRRARQSS